MRFNLKLLPVLAFTFYSSVFPQAEVSLPRGDAGRTGEFNVRPIESFGTVIWKSPKVIDFASDARGVVSGEVLGERVSWSQSGYGPWRGTASPELRSQPSLFIAHRYSLPMFGLGKESSPIRHRNSLVISLNVGPSMEFDTGRGDGFLVSVETGTGRPVFVYKCGKCYLSNPTGYNDWIIITTRLIDEPHKGSVRAINASTGALEWAYPIGSSLVTPTVYGDTLYFMEGPSRPDPPLAQSSETSIHAFDLKSQKITWSFKAKGIFDTPAISNGLLFGGSHRDYLYAIDLSDGKEKWRFKAEARAPAVRDGSVYFSDNSNLYAVDAVVGTLKWKVKVRGGVDQAIAISKSKVFFSSGNNWFHALDVDSGQTVWSVKTKAFPFEPITSGNRVFVGGERDLLMFDSETGKKFETVKLGREIAHTPVLLDDTAIIYNGDGYFFAVKK